MGKFRARVSYKDMNIFKKAKLYWDKERRERPLTVHTRRQLDKPGFMRLIIPVEGDPLREWKAWGDRVVRRYEARLPGNWKTKRGIKKRMRALGRL